MDAVSGSRYEPYDATCLLKHGNNMKAADARSEKNNLDGDIDTELTHDRRSSLDKFTTSSQFLLEISSQCWVSYGTI